MWKKYLHNYLQIFSFKVLFYCSPRKLKNQKMKKTLCAASMTSNQGLHCLGRCRELTVAWETFLLISIFMFTFVSWRKKEKKGYSNGRNLLEGELWLAVCTRRSYDKSSLTPLNYLFVCFGDLFFQKFKWILFAWYLNSMFEFHAAAASPLII